MGRREEGMKVLEEIIAGHPGEFEALKLLGMLKVEAGRLQEGAGLLREALRVRPESRGQGKPLVVIAPLIAVTRARDPEEPRPNPGLESNIWTCVLWRT